MAVMRVENVFAHFEHDVNICFEYNGMVYSYELERLMKERYFQLCGQYNWGRSFDVLSFFKNVLLQEFDVTNIVFENLFFNLDLNWGDVENPVPDNFKALFANKSITELDHHECHASSAFYQSPFEEALVFSYDGGGTGPGQRLTWSRPLEWDYTVLYLASRKNGLRRLCNIPVNFGGFYNTLCNYPDHIQWPPEISMAGCGKFMGLAGHWPVDSFFVEVLKDQFRNLPFMHKDGATITKEELWGLVKHFNFPYGGDHNDPPPNNHIKEFHHSAVYASHWQEAFTQIILETLQPYVEKYNYPLCVTGGCALNVLTNERIRIRFNREVFVPPNPSDCGIAIGGMGIHTDIDISNTVYNNFDILDRDDIPDGSNVSMDVLADVLCSGGIMGVVNGRSECGPRALGNRSILCNPSIPDMKATLNSKVKYREWFRPFAPMVRYEDRNKYFVFDGDSPYMSFACPVRETYRDELPAITHADGTARLQTVKESDNPFIYELLTNLEKKGIIPVLLNTSFNIKGKPILTTVEDAFNILKTTQLDFLYIEGKMYEGISTH